MNKTKYVKLAEIVVSILIVASAGANAGYVFGEEYREFEIKQGMREDAVNEKYGRPVLSEKMKEGFLPIPKKKALYKIGDSTYMMLHFFSGRVSDITVLDDVDLDRASSVFRKN